MRDRLELHVLSAVDKDVHTVNGNATDDKDTKETQLETYTHTHTH